MLDAGIGIFWQSFSYIVLFTILYKYIKSEKQLQDTNIFTVK